MHNFKFESPGIRTLSAPRAFAKLNTRRHKANKEESLEGADGPDQLEEEGLYSPKE